MVFGLPKHTVRISKMDYKLLQHIALINDRYVSAEIRIAVKNHIDAFEAERGKIDRRKLPKD